MRKTDTERLAKIHEVLNKRECKILVMYLVDGLSQEEIAKKLKIQQSSVCIGLSKAKKKLEQAGLPQPIERGESGDNRLHHRFSSRQMDSFLCIKGSSAKIVKTQKNEEIDNEY